MSERYEIRGRVGRGGMSAVYRAYDKVMAREVAIKRLLPVEETNLNEKAENLIEREASALARFQHPNIVTIYAMEEDEEGSFVAMELIEGEDLHAVMEDGALSWEDFQDVAPQCLEPLVAAAELGLLHRDIKPGNIMLTMTPAERFLVKILDFGLAKFSEQPSLQTLDQQGSFLGSIDYIAPEQLELKPLDQRTDLYSLGCVLYYALTQKAPFTGENPARTSMNHLKHRCRHISELRSDLPKPIADWLMRMISREVEDRPRDASEALEELLRALKGEDVEKAPSPSARGAPATVPVESGSIPATPAPMEDVRPPGEEDVPVAKIAEPSKPKIITTSPPETSTSGPKMVVPKKTAGAAPAVPKKAVATPPPRPGVKRVKQPESPAKGLGISLGVGGVLLAIIVGIVVVNRSGEEVSRPSGKAEARPEAPVAKGKAPAKGRKASAPADLGPLPLPKALVWNESDSAVAKLPEVEGLLLRFASTHFVLGRDYQKSAGPGDQVAAWGDLNSRSRKWSMVRDMGDRNGEFLPTVKRVTTEQIAPLKHPTEVLSFSPRANLDVVAMGLDGQEAFTIFLVAKFHHNAGKVMRLNAGKSGGRSFDLSVNNPGHLVATIRDNKETTRSVLKWGKGTAGIVALRFDGEKNILQLEGIRANGTFPPPTEVETSMATLPMQKICLGNRDFDADLSGSPSHLLLEFLVYTEALSHEQTLEVQTALARHYFAPGT